MRACTPVLWGRIGAPEHLGRADCFSIMEGLLANLSYTLPSRPVLSMEFHEGHRSFDRLFFRLQFKHRVPAENLLSLGEGPIGHSNLSPRQLDARAPRSGCETAAVDHLAGFRRLFGELCHGVHQPLWRRTRILGGLDYHHESHRHNSFLL